MCISIEKNKHLYLNYIIFTIVVHYVSVLSVGYKLVIARNHN